MRGEQAEHKTWRWIKHFLHCAKLEPHEWFQPVHRTHKGTQFATRSTKGFTGGNLCWPVANEQIITVVHETTEAIAVWKSWITQQPALHTETWQAFIEKIYIYIYIHIYKFIYSEPVISGKTLLSLHYGSSRRMALLTETSPIASC